MTTPFFTVLLVFALHILLKDFQGENSNKALSMPIWPLNMPGLYELMQGNRSDCNTFFLLENQGLEAENFKKLQLSLQMWPALSCITANPSQTRFKVSQNSSLQTAKALLKLNEARFSLLPTESQTPVQLSFVPDGIVKVKSSNTFVFSVNDHRLAEYHRANGLTKLNLGSSYSANYFPLLKVTPGLLELEDLIVKNLLLEKSFLLLSAIAPMPSGNQPPPDFVVQLMLGIFFTFALGLTFPLALSALAQDSQAGFRDYLLACSNNNSNINKNTFSLKQFFICHFTYQFTIAFCGLTLAWLGILALLDLSLFHLQLIDLFSFIGLVLLWQIVQLVCSLALSQYLPTKRTASIAGYLLSFWGTIISLPCNSIVYCYPLQLPLFLYLHPGIIFSRIVHVCSVLSFLGKQFYEEKQFIMLVFGLLGWLLPPLFFIIKNILQLNGSNINSKQIDNINKQLSQSQPSTNNSKHQLQQCILSCDNLSFKYQLKDNAPYALNKVSLKVRAGEIFGLLGPNGAGKSTLIHLITKKLRPQSCFGGSFQVTGSIGICPQFDIVWPSLTVQQHILFFLRLKALHDSTQVVTTILQKVGLDQQKHLTASELSGGMRRRLSIAIATIGQPSLLILDEPSCGLDPSNRQLLWKIIRSNSQGRSVILTTHSMDEADRLCTRLVVLRKGKLRFQGTPNQLKQHFHKGFILKWQGLPQRILGVEEIGGKRDQQKGKEGLTIYRFKGKQMMRKAIAMVKQNGILQWRISQSNLQQAYLQAMSIYDQEERLQQEDRDAFCSLDSLFQNQ